MTDGVDRVAADAPFLQLDGQARVQHRQGRVDDLRSDAVALEDRHRVRHDLLASLLERPGPRPAAGRGHQPYAAASCARRAAPTADKYALSDASMESVLAAWPTVSWSACRPRTVTSASASFPLVTARVCRSSSVSSSPRAASVALSAASSGPLPTAEAERRSPSTSTSTVAVGRMWLPATTW